MEDLSVAFGEDRFHSFSYRIQDHIFSSIKESSGNVLSVMKEPDDNDKLRQVSEEVRIDSAVKLFLQEYLLPTMYAEGGIGIAAIQVGIPIRAFIVDIPVVKTINGKVCETPNPRYVKNSMKVGKILKVREHRALFRDGQKTSYVKEYTLDQPCDTGVTEEVELERNPMFIINPRVEHYSQETVVIEEGCLSVPHQYVEEVYGNNTQVLRPMGVRISYSDLEGNTGVIVEADGTVNEEEKLLARALQHEYDHLCGVLFIDKLYTPQLN